jgi:O-antigen/teichoic acid export membrane protein
MTADQEPSRRHATRRSLILSLVTLTIAMTRNIVLVPVYLDYISIELYGAWLATGASLAGLIVSDFGLAGVIGQRTAKACGARDMAEVGRAIGTGLFASGVVSVAMTVLAVAVAPMLSMILHLEGSDASLVTQCFTIVALACGGAVIGLSCGTVLRSLQRPTAPGLAEVTAELTALFVTFLLLLRGWGLMALPLGLAARSTCLLVVNCSALAWVCRRRLGIGVRIQFSIAKTRWLWRDSWYQFIASMAMRLQISAQPLMVGAVLGGSAAAVFGITHCAVANANLLVGRLGGAFLPSFTHLFGEGSIERCREVLRQFLSANALLASVLMGGILAFNQEFVSLWVGSGLYGGDLLTALLILCAVSDAFMGASYSAVTAGGGFRLIARVMVISASTQVAITLGLLTFGLWGAAAGALVASLLRLWLLGRYARTTLFSSDSSTARRGHAVRETLRLVAPGMCLGIVVALSDVAAIESWQDFVMGTVGFVVLVSGMSWLIGKRQIVFIMSRGESGVRHASGGTT